MDERFGFEVGPLIEVWWIDSSGAHAWNVRLDEIDNPVRKKAMYVRSVGFVIAEDDDSLMLAEAVTAHDRIGCSTTIPQFAIVRRIGLVHAEPAE